MSWDSRCYTQKTINNKHWLFMGQTVVSEMQAVQLLNKNNLGLIIKSEPLTGGHLKLCIMWVPQICFWHENSNLKCAASSVLSSVFVSVRPCCVFPSLVFWGQSRFLVSSVTFHLRLFPGCKVRSPCKWSQSFAAAPCPGWALEGR